MVMWVLPNIIFILVIYGSYFDYTLQWEKHIDDGNILVLTFEDMKVVSVCPTVYSNPNNFYCA